MKDVWEDGVAEGIPVRRSIYWGRQLDPPSQRRAGETGWSVIPGAPAPRMRWVGRSTRPPLLPLVLPVGLMRVSLFLTALLMGISALAPEANAQRRTSGEATHSVTLFFSSAGNA